MAKISIVIPFHWMENWPFFLQRCLTSIEKQSFTDYEVILMKVGSMPETSNRAIEAAQGDIVKILYMDDMFSHEDSLAEIVELWPFKWLVSACNHVQDIPTFNEHFPVFDDRIMKGINTIGSPSVLAFENKNPLLFDERMSWVLDVDLYRRLYERYGEPTLLKKVNITIGLHKGQTTNILTEEEKNLENEYLLNKIKK